MESNAAVGDSSQSSRYLVGFHTYIIAYRDSYGCQ